MNRLKDIWGGQDEMNRVLFLIAVAVFVWSLIEGHGMYGALMAGVVLFLMVSRHGQRLKRFSRPPVRHALFPHAGRRTRPPHL